jgi:uncharacterized membrane protein YsdA (DUF1294 family)
VHINSFANRQRRPIGNERLTYELKTDTNGREQAQNVLFHGETIFPVSSNLRKSFPIIFAGIFLTFVASLTFIGKLPFIILALYLIASIVTFIAYSFDKSAAQNDEWRTQESTLHFFALVGGWPGALTAQKLLRHKSRKQSFQIVFWATVIINCGILGWLFTPSGAEKLHAILGTIQRLTSQ